MTKKLEIALPDEPNADQQGWLDEMENAKNGREFDQIYMKSGDMVLQSEFVASWADRKRLAFIGQDAC